LILLTSSTFLVCGSWNLFFWFLFSGFFFLCWFIYRVMFCFNFLVWSVVNKVVLFMIMLH
jgi:hypothetical protein